MTTYIIIKFVLYAVAIMIAAAIIPGVSIKNFGSALLTAIVLAILNYYLRPILVFFSIPITILTLGLFLLVINVIIIYLASSIVKGFYVSGFLAALIFSFVLSIVNYILDFLFLHYR